MHNSPISLIPSPNYYICIALLCYTHIGTILQHKAIRPYGHNPKIWPYGHMALCYYGTGWTQYGYLLKAQYKCRSLAKELNLLEYVIRNESKNKILENFPMYIFQNPFITSTRYRAVLAEWGVNFLRNKCITI